MPDIRNTLNQGHKNVLKWLANSYKTELPGWIPGIGNQNVGEMLSGSVGSLRDIDAMEAAGVTDRTILNKIKDVRNRRISGGSGTVYNVVDVPEVGRAARSGGMQDLYKAIDNPNMQRIKTGVIWGAAIGAIVGAVDPDKTILGNAALFAAEGFLFETFMPTLQYLYMTSALVGLGVGTAGNISRASSERLNHVMSGRGLYSQHDPLQNQFAGNIRRQSMGYMLQSRQNTQSFMGSEATYMHTTS